MLHLIAALFIYDEIEDKQMGEKDPNQSTVEESDSTPPKETLRKRIIDWLEGSDDNEDQDQSRRTFLKTFGRGAVAGTGLSLLTALGVRGLVEGVAEANNEHIAPFLKEIRQYLELPCFHLPDRVVVWFSSVYHDQSKDTYIYEGSPLANVISIEYVPEESSLTRKYRVNIYDEAARSYKKYFVPYETAYEIFKAQVVEAEQEQFEIEGKDRENELQLTSSAITSSSNETTVGKIPRHRYDFTNIYANPEALLNWIRSEPELRRNFDVFISILKANFEDVTGETNFDLSDFPLKIILTLIIDKENKMNIVADFDKLVWNKNGYKISTGYYDNFEVERTIYPERGQWHFSMYRALENFRLILEEYIRNSIPKPQERREMRPYIPSTPTPTPQPTSLPYELG